MTEKGKFGHCPRLGAAYTQNAHQVVTNRLCLGYTRRHGAPYNMTTGSFSWKSFIQKGIFFLQKATVTIVLLQSDQHCSYFSIKTLHYKRGLLRARVPCFQLMLRSIAARGVMDPPAAPGAGSGHSGSGSFSWRVGSLVVLASPLVLALFIIWIRCSFY